MQWSEFFKSVDAGDIAPVYLFTGPEERIKQEALEKLKQKLLPPGLEALNDAVMEGVTVLVCALTPSSPDIVPVTPSISTP